MGRKKGPRPLDDVAGGAEILPLPAYAPQTTGARLATVANPELTVAERQRLREQLRELERRQFESLRLYEPLPVQQAFHASRSRSRIIVGSNRSGKTQASVSELAWALSGTHPDTGKFPLESGRALVVGRSLEKIGEVVYRKLCRAGAFRIVRDPLTGCWRAKRPGDTLADKPAPPLLPPRLIADTVWESRKAMIPKKLVLRNGWECNFYSGEANPLSIEGVDVDIVMFDEEIVHQSWLPEALARLIDRRGYFWWSATPHVGTQQLYDLHQRATAYAEEADLFGVRKTPPVQEFFLSLYENTHLDEEAKKEFAEGLDEENRRTRVLGEFAITGTRVFESSLFLHGPHGVDPFPVPPTWCRFCAIDPGFQVGAVLFAAIPPPKYDGWPGVDPALYGDFLYVYDEIYVRDCTAALMAKAFKEHVGDQEMYVHLIDHHGGTLTEIGTGISPEQQYRNAFREAKIKHPTTGGMFTYGSDDVAGRILKIKDSLRVRPDGTARLRFIRGAVPHTERELKRYHWKTVAGVVTDKPVKTNDHQCFVAGTMIRTDHGDVPIERIVTGDLVLTRRGYRRVLAAGITHESAEVVTVDFSDGRSLTGTSGHPIFTIGSILVALGYLGYNDIVESIPDFLEPEPCLASRPAIRLSASSTRGSNFGVTSIRPGGQIGSTSLLVLPTRSVVSSDSTKKSGGTITGRYRRARSFITTTEIRRTMILGTSSSCRTGSTLRTTWRSTSVVSRMSNARHSRNTWMKSGHWLPPGIRPRPGSRSTLATVKRTGRTVSRLLTGASCVARSFSPRLFRVIGSSIAPGIANRRPVFVPGSTTSPCPAPAVAGSSSRTSTPGRFAAPLSVLSSYEEREKQAVYNLTVADAHEYYANGILVHNCDNLGYIIMYNRLTYHKPRTSTVKAEDGYAVWKKLKEREQRRLRRQGKQLPGITLA